MPPSTPPSGTILFLITQTKITYAPTPQIAGNPAALPTFSKIWDSVKEKQSSIVTISSHNSPISHYLRSTQRHYACCHPLPYLPQPQIQHLLHF